jgi:hypothetical protein
LSFPNTCGAGGGRELEHAEARRTGVHQRNRLGRQLGFGAQHGLKREIRDENCGEHTINQLIFLFSARARGRFLARDTCDRARAENKKFGVEVRGFYK